MVIGKMTINIAEQRLYLTSQCRKQVRSDDAWHSVATVHNDVQALGKVDIATYPCQIGRFNVEGRDRAPPLPDRRPRVRIQQSNCLRAKVLNFLRCEAVAIPDNFYAVVIGWIVAGRQHHTKFDARGMGRKIEKRCRREAKINNIASFADNAIF